jgi:UDP-N-acetylmuramoylalanine--D-glutamate ligase
VERLVVLGAGESGVGAALLGQKERWDVFVSDRGKIREEYRDVLLNHDIEFEENGHSIESILTADLVVKSPGIPDDISLIQQLREEDIDVISEIEFAGRYSKAKFIGITGTNGKTTTASLTYHILKSAGINVGLAGNIGKSLARLIAEEKEFDWVVLEVSSFQLDGMYDFKCDIAILLNITEDHLDRYDNSMLKYAKSKIRIAQNQTDEDWFIYNQDDAQTAHVLDLIESKGKRIPISIENKIEGEGAFKDFNQLNINLNNNPFTMTIQQLALQGKHNLHNSMASGIAARILEVRKEVIRECLSDFQNIEHRLELVNSVYGMRFINDSKATNVNSCWYALESTAEPVVWIAGGVDKGNDYEQLKELAKGKVRAIICLGKDNAKIREAFEGVVDTIIETDNMRDAVYNAYKQGEKGDTVLFSPACASFDLFEDYEDRGRKFKEAVRNL